MPAYWRPCRARTCASIRCGCRGIACQTSPAVPAAGPGRACAGGHRRHAQQHDRHDVFPGLIVPARARKHGPPGVPGTMTPPSSQVAESVFPPGGPCRWTGYPIVSAVRWPAGEPFLSPGRIHPPGPSTGHDRTSCMPRARLAPDAPRTACRCPGRRGRDSCCSACASACCSPNTCRAELAPLTRMTWMAIAGGPLAEQARSTGIYGARAAMNRRR